MVQRFFLCSTWHCPERGQDLHLLRNHLLANGYEETNSIGKADVIIVCTCAVLEFSENEALKIIRGVYHAKKNGAKVIVEGCLPVINPKKLESIHHGPVLIPRKLEQIDKILHLKVPLGGAHYSGKLDSNVSLVRILSSLRINGLASLIMRGYNYLCEGKYETYSIRINMGCTGHCTYCAIKGVHGDIVSKSVDLIVSEFKRGLKEGYHSILLYSVDVAGYGRDIGTNFTHLLEKIFEIPGNYEVKLYNSLNPGLLMEQGEEFIRVLGANRGRIRSIILSIESGSPTVLKRMGRGKLNLDKLKKYLKRIKRELPEVELLGQFMIGFPGETEKDFSATLNFIDGIDFGMISFYRAEIRPNTPAAKMPGRLAPKIINNRIKRFKEFLTRNGLKFKFENPVQ